MLECAIPECTCTENFLRSGSLHLVDLIRPDGNVAKRMIWLCGECTSRYAVQTWRPAGEQIRFRETSTGQIADVLQMPHPRLEAVQESVQTNV